MLEVGGEKSLPQAERLENFRLKKSQLTQNLLPLGVIFGLRNQLLAEQIGYFLQPIINGGATGRRNF